MPSRNSIKNYVEGGFYHVCNRGVERRRIFEDDNDYRAFLHLLKYYFSPPQKPSIHPLTELTGFTPVRKRPVDTLHDKADLLSFCLMPNHFHLLIRQKDKYGIESLMRRLLTTYVMYFNRRYDREGHLFQGTYKACLVENDNYLLHLSRYIHQNPTLTKRYLNQYPYSSYPYYIEEKKSDWINTDHILSYFDNTGRRDFESDGITTYKEFVESYDKEPEDILGKLTLGE
jgi:putative transposase